LVAPALPAIAATAQPEIEASIQGRQVVNINRICVGVDGSLASQSALRWAAAEAAAHDAELTVVHAYDWRVVGNRVPVPGGIAEQAKSDAESIVATAIEQALAVAPGLTVKGEAVHNTASDMLVKASALYDLTVLGSRGHGGFASLLLGSASQHVATHAVGTVAVVRGRPDVATGPVVVGVDGSPASAHAAQLAFEEAIARGAEVLAVRVYIPRSAGLGVDFAVPVEDTEQRREEELRHLAEDVAAWQEKYPDVSVRTVALDGHTAEVLIGLSSSAQLVVVGTRGHGGFAGLLLGSVGLQLLHHAECPVLIARANDES
jgi:nucleotide-binding universal stress UspA family protein